MAVLAGVFLVSQPANRETSQITPSPTSAPQNTEKKARPLMPEQTDGERASFAIFTNGTFRIFTDPRYHKQSSDVYVENSASPNTIIVEKEGITWGDFFKTLPMSLTDECLITGTKQTFCTGEGGTLGFYINGNRVNNALGMEISDGDKLLVSFGSQSEAEIKSQLSQVPALPASD